MGIVILVIVGLVGIQVWWDWRALQRDARGATALPKWMGGLALSAMILSVLGGFASMGSALYQHSLAEIQGAAGGSFFVPEAGFLLCCLGVIIAALKKKSARTLLLVMGVLAFAVWLGFAMYS